MEDHTITGTVVGLTKRNLSREYQNTAGESYEMLLPFGTEMRLDRIRDVKDVKRGDTVTISYRQKYRQETDGTQTLVKTVVTSISLVKSGSTQTLSPQGGRLP